MLTISLQDLVNMACVKHKFILFENRFIEKFLVVHLPCLRYSPRRAKSHWTQLNMDRCVDLEDRGLMTEAGRRAFEKAFGYEIIPPDSEINQRIKEEAKLRRPGMYSRKDNVLRRNLNK